MNAIFKLIFHKFLYMFMPNLFACKSTYSRFNHLFNILVVGTDCVADRLKGE